MYALLSLIISNSDKAWRLLFAIQSNMLYLPIFVLVYNIIPEKSGGRRCSICLQLMCFSFRVYIRVFGF